MPSKFTQIKIDKNIYNVIIPYADVSVAKKKIGFLIGYANGELPSHTEEMIDEIIFKLSDKIQISAGYSLLELQYSASQPSGLIIGNIFFSTDKIITSQLKKAEKAAVFLCTIGNQMENWTKKLLVEGNSVQSYLVDVRASTIVESVADQLHDHIVYEMEKYGWNKTNRYSPGYCNWPVSEQQKIFSFFPQNFCNVQLTESSLMIPIKSISGVVGLGSKVKYSEYLCDKCGIKDCTHRIYLLSKQKEKNNISK
jgi:hypothetical protein